MFQSKCSSRTNSGYFYKIPFNSRVKLTNIEDCIKKGYVSKGQNPLEVAAKQLEKDNIDILHTIGGDDTPAPPASTLWSSDAGMFD